MSEQRQDESNGIGKAPVTGKKRRKGQDLQPIQTAPPPLHNGVQGGVGSAAGASTAAAGRGYLQPTSTAESPNSPLNHRKAAIHHKQHFPGWRAPQSVTSPAKNDTVFAHGASTGLAVPGHGRLHEAAAPLDWETPGHDAGGSDASEEENLDDYCKGGYHPVEPGQVYKNGRYTVVRKLGWGHFSTVWLARDNFKNRHVALKVVRSATQYKETALDEIKLLERIATANPSHPGRQHIVSLLDHFEHVGPNGDHICLVFEALGESVLSTIKRYQYRGLPVHIVKQITKQVLLGLDYLHRECGVIHTDLKPENVLIAIDNTEEVIAESTWTDTVDIDQPRQWKTPQPPRYPFQAEQQRIRPRRFVTRSQPLPSPASVVPKSFAHELNRAHENNLPDSPPRNGWSSTTDLPSNDLPKPVREATADLLERDLSDMSLDYQLRKSQLAGSRNRSSQDLHTIKVKIIDVGNACWVSEHFTNDLQTRQYRAPEVILGAPWGASADVWSMSCMVFELLTGEYLFDPKESRTYRKDEDHVAQMIELLGDFPSHFIRSGIYSHEIFNSRGHLRNIHRLTYWGLPAVLKEKYDRADHAVEADFMLKMLEVVPSRRADAGGMVDHEWLRDTIGMENVTVGRPVGGRGQGIPGWSEVVKMNRHRR